jgi:hypothetical protein
MIKVDHVACLPQGKSSEYEASSPINAVKQNSKKFADLKTARAGPRGPIFDRFHAVKSAPPEARAKPAVYSPADRKSVGAFGVFTFSRSRK